MAAREQVFTIVRPTPVRLEEERFQAILRRFPVATDLEAPVLWWLETKAGYQINRDFYFQASALGGRSGKGFVLDFLVVRDQPRPLDIEIQSEAFHQSFVFGDPVAIKGYDRIRRQVLESNGYAVVFISGERVRNALDDTMRRALQGQDVL